MINDDHDILVGLYRECDSVRTLVSMPTLVKKELIFDDKVYILTDKVKNSSHIWFIHHEDKNLSREDIINLFAYHNLKRQMK